MQQDPASYLAPVTMASSIVGPVTEAAALLVCWRRMLRGATTGEPMKPMARGAMAARRKALVYISVIYGPYRICQRVHDMNSAL